MSEKKTIAIIFTGGTISMRKDDAFGGVVPSLAADEILSRTPAVYDIANLVVEEFGRYPGPHMHPAIMKSLAEVVQRYADDPAISGVVVTHGTDSLEETAYFLDLTVSTDKPVVVIGSMRNSSEPDWDGPRNLRDGILIAAAPQARNLGVMVLLAESILAASEATKVDTTNINTFESPDFGPIGRLINGRVFIYRGPVHRDTLAMVKPLPKLVPVITSYTTDEAFLVGAAVDAGADGIVIEAFGVGNVPPVVFAQIQRAIARNIPVVLVSRCPIGRVDHIYAYEGAGMQLYKAGVIFADYLNAQKARIKLVVALAAGMTHRQLQESFAWDDDTPVQEIR